MYSIYSDLRMDEEDENIIKQNKDIQFERDKKLFIHIKRNKIPSFPMDDFEFINHIEKFKEITVEDKRLRLVFNSNDKTHVLKDGIFYVFNTIVEAFRWTQDIKDNIKLSIHAMKYENTFMKN